MEPEPTPMPKNKSNRAVILGAIVIAIIWILGQNAVNNRKPTAVAVAFGSNLGNALVQAQRLNKPVMVDVYTDWCTWCKKLDRDVYSRADVAVALKDFVSVKVNPETDPEAKAFAAKMKVDGFPTILFLNAKGEEVHRIGGYVDGPEFVRQTGFALERALGRPGNLSPAVPSTGGT